MIDHLAAWRAGKFVWGKSDCILAPCNVVWAETGIDPAEEWRGTYHDRAGADAILAKHGGVLSLFSFGMARAGFNMTTEPRRFCPVICQWGEHQIGGMWLEPRKVAFMAELQGCVETRASILGVWAL